ncbi:MAG: hypothetical protein ABII23_02920 [bacterium]
MISNVFHMGLVYIINKKYKIPVHIVWDKDYHKNHWMGVSKTAFGF